jgi:hypothetical protein
VPITASVRRLVPVLVLGVVFALPRAGASQANSDISAKDIERLQQDIDRASRDVRQVDSQDTSLTSRLRSELDDAQDEATYLKVKLRRGEPVSRDEYTDLRNRIADLDAEARGDYAGSGQTGTYPPSRRGSASVGTAGSIPEGTRGVLPVGTEFDTRLQTPLSSATANPEDRFTVTTLVDLEQDGRVLVPAGSVLQGTVSAAKKAGRLERKGSLTLDFDRIVIQGTSYPVRATPSEALETEGIRGEVGTIGTGAGVGAILGGILGGVKGALAGILIGGGGTVAATEGKDVELRSGTVLRVRLDSPLDLR